MKKLNRHLLDNDTIKRSQARMNNRIEVGVPILGQKPEATKPPSLHVDTVGSAFPLTFVFIDEQGTPHIVVEHGVPRLHWMVGQLVAGGFPPKNENLIGVARDLLQQCDSYEASIQPKPDDANSTDAATGDNHD